MALSARHPEFLAQLDIWETMRDCYEGERAIKAKGLRYLPATTGQLLDGLMTSAQSDGAQAYEAYKLRASFPSFTKEATESLLGILHRKDAIVRVPEMLQPFLKRMTREGENVQMLLRRLNTQQILMGRIGVLLDLPGKSSRTPMPYAAVYDAETIVNWDSDPYIGPNGQRRVTLVVLNEARYERQPGDEWVIVQYYRKLELTEDGFYEQSTYRNEDELTRVRPLIANNPLGKIPFYFLNAKHVLPETDPPPLEGLASLCLAIYRGEADLRQLLHMSAQDTLVVPGGDPETKYRTGAGAVITPPVDSKVHYAGVSTSGLSEMRHVLEADKKLAAVRGAQLIDTTSRQRESGDALRIRVAAQTATLHQIALASGEAIKELLREAARWMGVSESEVEQIEVLPNVDFTAETVTGKDMLDMVTAKAAGFPISLETMWDYARRGGVGDRTFAEEQELIDVEPPLDMQEPTQQDSTGTGQDVTGGSQNSQ